MPEQAVWKGTEIPAGKEVSVISKFLLLPVTKKI